jgi:acetolactate synthase-1/2/3 large subunit
MSSAIAQPRLGGHILVDNLIAQGVDLVFGVPGESFLAVLDGFYAAAGQDPLHHLPQEGGAANMADAYGKLTGKPGICMVTRGPGATNASIGVHTAFQDSTPMILFIGQVGGDFVDREAFQEIDYRQMFGRWRNGRRRSTAPTRFPNTSVTRSTSRRRVAGTRGSRSARRHADDDVQRGRRGPAISACRRRHRPGDIALLAQMLEAPKGRRRARRQRLETEGARRHPRFAEAWQLPVGCAFRCQDLFDNSHPQYMGDVGIGIARSSRRGSGKPTWCWRSGRGWAR